ncbi:hypothetical protein OUZ56_020193 [Daphnia magna]|uniref:Uncharacterized protein n=1 Tax=Daphnia magna TaxID=35525 RepID=A0ABQ9ZDS7_9CRUS|nr:hypothetical protein OUZ56_020193 [Daphnia magna]
MRLGCLHCLTKDLFVLVLRVFPFGRREMGGNICNVRKKLDSLSHPAHTNRQTQYPLNLVLHYQSGGMLLPSITPSSSPPPPKTERKRVLYELALCHSSNHWDHLKMDFRKEDSIVVPTELVSALDHHLMCRRRLPLGLPRLSATQQLVLSRSPMSIPRKRAARMCRQLRNKSIWMCGVSAAFTSPDDEIHLDGPIAVYEGACWDYVLVNVLIAFLACFLKMARLVNGANEADQFLTAQTMEKVARFH